MQQKSKNSFSIVLLVCALLVPVLVGLDLSEAQAQFVSSVLDSPIETPPPTDPPPTETPAPTETSLPTETPTEPPSPTSTAIPTNTPTPVVTSEPSPTATAEPNLGTAKLAVSAPDSVSPGETFQVSVEAKDVTQPGIYGVQLELHYDPALITADNVQVNPEFDYILRGDADNSAGKITLIVSEQGKTPGLTGNLTLLTFEATAADTTGTAGFALDNVKLSDPQANSFEFVSADGSVAIVGDNTPTPSPEPSPEPTNTPDPEPTNTPDPEPTNTPTPEPDPTDTPDPDPTNTPDPEPTTTPDPEPDTATVFGQVILAGRANNDWSGAALNVIETGQLGVQVSAITDRDGNFTLDSVVTDSDVTLTADAPGYLSAVCAGPTIAAPETELLPVTLLSGDVNDDEVVDIGDATAIGVSFDETGSGLVADINRDEIIDIFDLVLVSINFEAAGPITWECQQ